MTNKTDIKRKRKPNLHHDADERKDHADHGDKNHEQPPAKPAQKRGRPRVEKRDQSAVERRRAQIRTAQRAYRARKDSTISQLQAREAELIHTLQDAILELQGISDRIIVEEDIKKSSLREDIHHTIIKLMDVKGEADAPKQDSSSDDNKSPFKSDSTKLTATNDGALAQVPEGSPEYQAGIGDGLSDDDGDRGSQPRPTDMSTEDWSISWNNPFQMNSGSLLDSLPAIETSQFLQLPRQTLVIPTFSWQESTFSRRLLRHSHEMCLRHIENPSDQYADWLNRARYSLAFMSQDALIQKLKFSVARPKGDPLEDWSMPMLHIGGAGLHSESSNVDSTGDYRSAFERNVGPFQLPTAAVKVPPSAYPDGVADYLNLRGAYMDHRDVEVYLRRKGLRLSGAESTAVYEVPISESSDEDSMTFWTNSSAWTSRNIGKSLDFMDFDDDVPTSNEFNLLNDSSKALAMNGVLGRTMKRVMLSIDHLVELLNQKAVCLGRAPGYKQIDVDAAFNGVLAKASLVTV